MGQINEPQRLSFFQVKVLDSNDQKEPTESRQLVKQSNLQKFEHKLPSPFKGSNLGGILRWGRGKKHKLKKLPYLLFRTLSSPLYLVEPQ